VISESVLLASVNPELSGYSPPEIANFYHQLEERLRELPGVRAVGASEAALLSGDSSSVGPLYQAILDERIERFSPWVALTGINCCGATDPMDFRNSRYSFSMALKCFSLRSTKSILLIATTM